MNLSRRFSCLLLSATALCANRGFAQSPTLEALKEYPSAAKAFEKRMARARSELKRYRDGNRDAHLIVGRVRLEGDDDPETVVSQMVVVEQGFFVDVVRYLDRPVGFRCHRYKPVDFMVPQDVLPAEDDVIDVGIVQLSRASASKRGTTTGSLTLEGGGDPSGTTVTLSIVNARANTPSGGTEGIGRKYLRINGNVEADGTVKFESLSEGDYYLSFSRDGYVGQNKRISVLRLNEADVGVIELELPRRIDVDYVIAPDTDPEFDVAKRKSVAFVGGHKWKARPDIYGWDLLFRQADRKIQFDFSYAPCFLTDLGPGTLEDYFDVPLEVDGVSPRNVPVVSGHVYLLNQRFWKHQVLFRVDVGDAIPAGAEMPNGIPVSPGTDL